MADINDLLKASIDKNPVEFSNTFDSIVQDRIVNAVAERKQEIAQSLYGSDETPEDDVDDDFSDLDIEDLDLDLDSYDLGDIGDE